jgi:hypothetical protein
MIRKGEFVPAISVNIERTDTHRGKHIATAPGLTTA